MLEDNKYRLWDLRSKKTVFERVTPENIAEGVEKNKKVRGVFRINKFLKRQLDFMNERVSPLGLSTVTANKHEYNKEKIRTLGFLDKKVDKKKLDKLFYDNISDEFIQDSLESTRFANTEKLNFLKQMSEYEKPNFYAGNTA